MILENLTDVSDKRSKRRERAKISPDIHCLPLIISINIIDYRSIKLVADITADENSADERFRRQTPPNRSKIKCWRETKTFNVTRK